MFRNAFYIGFTFLSFTSIAAAKHPNPETKKYLGKQEQRLRQFTHALERLSLDKTIDDQDIAKLMDDFLRIVLGTEMVNRLTQRAQQYAKSEVKLAPEKLINDEINRRVAKVNERLDYIRSFQQGILKRTRSYASLLSQSETDSALALEQKWQKDLGRKIPISILKEEENNKAALSSKAAFFVEAHRFSQKYNIGASDEAHLSFAEQMAAFATKDPNNSHIPSKLVRIADEFYRLTQHSLDRTQWPDAFQQANELELHSPATNTALNVEQEAAFLKKLNLAVEGSQSWMPFFLRHPKILAEASTEHQILIDGILLGIFPAIYAGIKFQNYRGKYTLPNRAYHNNICKNILAQVVADHQTQMPDLASVKDSIRAVQREEIKRIHEAMTPDLLAKPAPQRFAAEVRNQILPNERGWDTVELDYASLKVNSTQDGFLLVYDKGAPIYAIDFNQRYAQTKLPEIWIPKQGKWHRIFEVNKKYRLVNISAAADTLNEPAKIPLSVEELMQAPELQQFLKNQKFPEGLREAAGRSYPFYGGNWFAAHQSEADTFDLNGSLLKVRTRPHSNKIQVYDRFNEIPLVAFDNGSKTILLSDIDAFGERYWRMAYDFSDFETTGRLKPTEKLLTDIENSKSPSQSTKLTVLPEGFTVMGKQFVIQNQENQAYQPSHPGMLRERIFAASNGFSKSLLTVSGDPQDKGFFVSRHPSFMIPPRSFLGGSGWKYVQPSVER